ncbi:TIGR02530 family flagellar biosynthesis protein [Jeotgalibacillus haloalkalitolerans]|uniref:TIGR02530 family flagellar biosynthesis protein n=1 Tax=Jeotgalibacillus haloalkalitolerans TaxID=3104292 RepID=A0ABU5KKD3_9BACL|nr:TIGR02530 family flagellar biosynthesis protein [Jeotgalibacillus sp. HH7-29]MDZ5711725.1 TIGR02530 family flagellar biosynthesis protein [Jeotgalibacillus sp. HH7-29]
MEHIRFNPIHTPPAAPVKKQTKQTGFGDKLQQVMGEELKFSRHANERLSSRNIQITPAQWQRVSDKVNEAEGKGVKDSLVLLDQAALIVSIQNRTVVTAMDKKDLNDQIFTGIDGTIILE